MRVGHRLWRLCAVRATAATLVAANPVPKARTENERALESWYIYFSHPPDEATCSKRFDRAGGVPVAEIINSIAAYETGRRRGVRGDFSITNRQVCGFLDKKEADEPHRVRRIGVKGDKKQAPAFMITTAKSKLPPRGKHRVTVDGKKMKKLAAAAATAAALKVSMALALALAPRSQSHTIPLPQDENEQLKVDKMDATAATALSAGPAEEPPPPPPPTEVKADSGHRYAPNFMLAMAELFSVAKGLSVAGPRSSSHSSHTSCSWSCVASGLRGSAQSLSSQTSSTSLQRTRPSGACAGTRVTCVIAP